MILHTSDIDDLIAAIESLRSDPWLDILIPTISAVLGILAGFFLSVAKGAYDRKSNRRDEIMGAIGVRRQAAVDVFSAEVKWIAVNFQVRQSQLDRAPHIEAQKNGPGLFDKTGRVTDEIVTQETREYLDTLVATVHSFKRFDRPNSVGYSTPHYSRLTPDISSQIRAQVDDVRKAAQRWVDEDRSSEWFRNIVRASKSKVEELHDGGDVESHTSLEPAAPDRDVER